jgi:hypothetical protein
MSLCLRLMGRKMVVALTVEGKFSSEGLQSLDADEDLMSAMARELVEKAGVGESADRVWQQLDEERARHMEQDVHELAQDSQTPIPSPEDSNDDGIHLVPHTKRGKPGVPPWPTSAPSEVPVQLSLFG